MYLKTMPRQDRKLALLESISSYQDFPSRSPIRDDQFTASRSPRTVTAAPESNSRAVRSALLNLQEKIRKLEQERAQAEGNLKSLASETTHYRDLMQRQQHVKQAPNVPSTKHSKELQSQLAGAESRSELLEKQLEYMRNMVRSAEQERNSALKQQELQTRQHVQVTSDQVSSQGVKLNSLEREHEQLKATQALAESKIQDLEHKLKEGRHQREILQSRAAQLQTEVKCKEILGESNPSHKVKRAKKKKTKPSSKKHTIELPSQRRVPCTSRHLRLKMENVPFIAGQATTPSHNVNVNMQNLIALMKTHNSAYCGNPPAKGRPNSGLTKTAKSRSVSVTSSDSDLSDLLLGLQDEFGQLAFEHQEITKQIQETNEHRLQEDLEQELSAICARMESKGDQISKLKRHKQKITKKTTVNTARPKPVRKVWSPSPTTTSAMNDGEVKVITTVKTRGKGIQVVSPDHKSQRNQCLLMNMKTLQTSLRKHDVSWD
ncbi:centrosomal protein of 57 kDa-like [Asterias rubens]|uniref:centrosomal protein of 57 kDa-like n=1 Tax=Asterias rubens TaxID=7604 RepID=UPI001455D536|nr:centrosomal protein of 57 kDa-like [Asterias rubens]